MKNLVWGALGLILLNTGCSKDERYEEPKIEYPLEVSLDKQSYWFDSIDTAFTILGGNGGYTVASSDSSIAKVSLTNDTIVHVAFISNKQVTITVADAAGKSRDIYMKSNNPSIAPHHYTLFFPKDSTSSTSISFGNGDYHIANVKGTSADITLGKDLLIVKGLSTGMTTFDVIDHRGTVGKNKVVVTDNEKTTFCHDIGFTVDKSSSTKVELPEGNWRILSHEEPVTKAELKGNILYITTSGTPGYDYIELINDEGLMAAVSVSINKP